MLLLEDYEIEAMLENNSNKRNCTAETATHENATGSDHNNTTEMAVLTATTTTTIGSSNSKRLANLRCTSGDTEDLATPLKRICTDENATCASGSSRNISTMSFRNVQAAGNCANTTTPPTTNEVNNSASTSETLRKRARSVNLDDLQIDKRRIKNCVVPAQSGNGTRGADPRKGRPGKCSVLTMSEPAASDAPT